MKLRSTEMRQPACGLFVAGPRRRVVQARGQRSVAGGLLSGRAVSGTRDLDEAVVDASCDPDCQQGHLLAAQIRGKQAIARNRHSAGRTAGLMSCQRP
ncbi:hypothetical protein Sros01_81920 [Streptomyces roseochromogenus]|nr:hypothetical protein Sros01_81920 [Streptomyces roseochromogenus]